jgi:hypothetical protein
MTHRTLIAAALGLASFAAFAQTATAPAAKPTQPAFCSNCHKAEARQDRRLLRQRCLQVAIDADRRRRRIRNRSFDPKAVKVIDAGEAKTAEHLRDVKKRHEVMVQVVEKDGVKFATTVTFKGPIKIAPEKLANYDMIAKLVADGPDKAKYTLIDSRGRCRATRKATFRRRFTCRSSASTSSRNVCRRTSRSSWCSTAAASRAP